MTSKSTAPNSSSFHNPGAGARRRIRALLPLAAAGSGILVFLLPFVSPVVTIPRWDEFIVVFDSQRLLNGQLPYRDFFNFIPPGVFFGLAALFWPFGRASLTVARYASLAAIVVNWGLLQVLLERAGWRRAQALGFSLLYPLALYPFWPVFSHHWLVHCACLAFLIPVASGPETWRPSTSAWMGALAGISGTVLQTEGLYLVLLWGTLALLAFRGRELWVRSGAFAAGVSAVLICWLAPLWALGAGPSFLRDVVLWPARNYSRPGSDNARPLLEDVPQRLSALWSGALMPSEGFPHAVTAVSGSLLYGGLLAAALSLPLLVGVVLIPALRRRLAPHALPLAASLVTALALGLFVRGRPDWLRLLYLCAFLWPLWLVAWKARSPGRVASRPAPLVAAAWVLVVCAVLFQGRWIWSHRPEAWELTDADRLTRESPVNRFLVSAGGVGPRDAVAAFPEGGEVYLYAGRPAVGYTYFTPLSEGYNDYPDHVRASTEIEANRPRWILMTTELEAAYLDPASPVALVIRRDYQRRGVIRDAVLYERKARPE